MSEYLLLIHIGPMQVFIAAARRTRDLWFGSWLMSELSKAAARAVAETAGEQNLIFPAASLAELEAGSDLAVANKIVAIVAEPQKVAKDAETAMRARLKELGEIALDAAEPDNSSQERKLQTKDDAEKQIKDLPEFYWVAVPLPDENDYLNVRKKAENLLAARKNLRDFNQPTWGSNKPKSSLDGNRESVIPKDVSGDAEKMYKWYKAKAGEQLSGVDLLKRLGKAGEEQNFSSTSHMAAMPLKTHLQAKASDTAVQQKWADYLAVLRTINSEIEKQEVIRHRLQLPIIGNLDGGLLFKSRLLDYMDKADTRKAEDKLNDFLKALLRDAKVKELIPYYALLVGDGDFMGRTINSLEKPEEHRNFSAALAGFASKAKGIVAEHDGAAVFTGGDDVLALLPVHQAIQCAAELAATFQKTMAATFQKTMKEAVKVGDPPTFSAGIAIFHHTEPLEDALQTAREAEQTAKGIKDKNALAVTEAKRSGAPRTVQGKWGKLDKRLLDLAAFFQAGALPSGLAYQLRDMYLHLGGQEAMKAGLKDVLAAEAGRIIKRKEGTTAAQAYVEKRVEQLGEGYTISQIAHELIIAANLAKAAEQAGMDLEKERA